MVQSYWCLLELREADREQIPIIVLARADFSLSAALSFLHHLEDNLRQLNPTGLGELRSLLGAEGSTVDSFGETLVNILEASFVLVSDDSEAETSNVFKVDFHATEEQFRAMLQGLVTYMLSLTGRELKWIVRPQLQQTSRLSWGAVLCEVICRCCWRKKHNLRHAVYIAYDPTDKKIAYEAASLMQLTLQDALQGTVAMELPAEKTKTEEDIQVESERLSYLMKEAVDKSDALVLVLTADVLFRPWTLLVVFECLHQGVPVATVVVTPPPPPSAAPPLRASGDRTGLNNADFFL